MNLISYFKKITQINPLQTAIKCDDRCYSYQQSLDIITSMSNHFISGDKNAALIYIEKNEYFIFSQLAINLANQIFIPLDIKTPIQRVSSIIEVTQPKYLILSKQIKSFDQYTLIHEDLFFNIWINNNESKIYNPNITHIYFSSGSTGTPKGILLNDDPIAGVVLQQASIININKDSKFAWLLSPSFDASLSDIYSTLFSGAELHICTFEQTKIKTLIHYFNENKITHSDLSPSVISIISPDKFNTLKNVIFGGEVANESAIKLWSSKINMFNAYGPTEATICSSLKQVTSTWTSENIGKPLNGITYSIDDDELILSGKNLCIGYINQELNDKKFFIKNNVNYYKSGDLVSKNEDGDYLFRGRKDRQFKYNGVLICPEEIEKSAIKAGCIEAFCKLDDKIILYYSGTILKETLREKISELIPLNMLPQIFIQKDTLDKNINGKIKL